MQSRKECALLLVVALVMLPLAAPAEEASTTPQGTEGGAAAADTAAEPSAPAFRSGIAGPATVPLGKEGSLALPAGYLYIGAEESAELMKRMGNTTGPTLRGMVIGNDEGHGGNWFAVIDYIDSGHLPEDDADTWKADDLLDSLREGTEASNEQRKEQGISEIELDGWIESPAYDKSTHRLVYSLGGHDKGAPIDNNSVVNYNTYQLGREGYFMLNLVTDRGSIEGQKPFARELLAATRFASGQRYEDFNEKTDHVAEYGLAALVAGVAAKKLGLLAMAGLFLAKAWKVIAVGVVAAGAGAKKFLGRKDGTA